MAFVVFTVVYFALALMHLVGGEALMPAWGPAVAALVATAYSAFAASREPAGGAARSAIAYLAVTLLAAAAVFMVASRFGRHDDEDDEDDRAGRTGISFGRSPWWLWAVAALPVGLLVLSLVGLWKRQAFGADRPVLVPKKSLIARRRADRQELLETVFHGFVTMLVELVALSGAFIFYLSGEARRALERPVLDALYNNNRGVLAGYTNELLNAACDVGSVGTALGLLPGQATERAGLASPCCAAGIPDRAARGARVLLQTMRTPNAERNEVATQNRWVFRTAILYVGMAVVAFFVAYVTNRLAGGPQVNIPSIVRYNVFLLAIALGLQVAFMFMVTLRYVPTEPSQQWRQLRESLNRELSQGAEGGAGAPADEDLQVVPPGALQRNAVLVGMLALSAVVVWFAWRSRAFQTVSFAQSVVIQTFFIGVIMTTIYFTLSRSVARDIQGAGMAAVARTVAAAVADDPEVAEQLRQEVNRIMDAREEDVAAVDERVRERNAEVMRPFRWIALAFVATLVVVLVVSAGGKVLSPRFMVALLAVGLVGGATSVTVEYGFLQNVFRNFRPLNAEKAVNRIVSSSAASVVRQAQWYCQRGCPSPADECCANGATCAAEDVVGAEGDVWPYLDAERE